MLRRLLRLANPEIALGFVIATVFWIGVLGWQAAYAPSEIEKRQCEESAHKSGHKTEECKTLWERTTSDPVAFFTFWLVVSTIGLGVSTVLLWRAGEKQLRHARRSIAIQSRDMRESIRVAEKSADVSLAAINLSEGTAERQLRAYVLTKGCYINTVGGAPHIQVQLQNFGQTPAHKLVVWVGSRHRPFPAEDRFWERVMEQSPLHSVSNLGPGAMTVGNIVMDGGALTEDELSGLQGGKNVIYAVGGFEYTDIFGKGHTGTFRFACGGPYPMKSEGWMTDCNQGNDTD
jgi:hypothetical protein